MSPNDPAPSAPPSSTRIPVSDLPQALAFHDRLLLDGLGWVRTAGAGPGTQVHYQGPGQRVSLQGPPSDPPSSPPPAHPLPDELVLQATRGLALAGPAWTRAGLSWSLAPTAARRDPAVAEAHLQAPDGRRVRVREATTVGHAACGWQVRLEPADQAEVVDLIAALDAWQDTLYPAESRHALSLEALSGPDARMVVARRHPDGAALACAALVFSADGRRAELKRMMVREEARGQGLAQALIARLVLEAEVMGCRLLQLETGPRQPAAIALYTRCGFHRTGPFGGYPDDPLSVFMARPLPRPAWAGPGAGQHDGRDIEAGAMAPPPPAERVQLVDAEVAAITPIPGPPGGPPDLRVRLSAVPAWQSGSGPAMGAAPGHAGPLWLDLLAASWVGRPGDLLGRLAEAAWSEAPDTTPGDGPGLALRSGVPGVPNVPVVPGLPVPGGLARPLTLTLVTRLGDTLIVQAHGARWQWAPQARWWPSLAC